MKESKILLKQQLKPFSERLEKAIGSRSVRGFSLECGISDRAIRHYLSCESEPTLTKLVTMAETAKVSIQWLATGEESSQPPLDKDALLASFEVVEWAINEANLNMTVERKSQLLVAVYKLCLASNQKADKDLILEMLQSVA